MKYKTIVEDNIDILVCGAGLGGTGAAFEARYWGQDKSVRDQLLHGHTLWRE